jgi:molybdopterin-guanine dinucleotide biosynthesis protein A
MSIGVFSFGRKQSQRCPNKMLRPFGGTTLTDIMLGKLATFGPNAFFAAEGADFRLKCERHGVVFVERDHHSVVIDEPIVEILSFLRHVPYEHVLLVNACMPFLSTDAIATSLKDCDENDRQPAFSVVRRHNYFMTVDRRPLNFDPRAKTINTKTVEPVYEFAHGLYFFERDYFFRHGTYWDWSTVRLIELPYGADLVDVDTEEDFRLAETLWEQRANVRR